MPARLLWGAQGSYYGFGYITDEYTYAQRIQPLVPGTTSLNPVNGICDPGIISPFYLEDACRAFLWLTGMPVITFFWIWRWLFPVVLAALLLLLAGECLRRKRPWRALLIPASAAAGLALLYCGYHVLLGQPLHNWLVRIPSNIEYPLALITIYAYLRFADQPSVSSALTLVATSLALIYLRPYAALPFGIMLSAGCGFLLARRHLDTRIVATLAIGLGVGGLPWVIAAVLNTQRDVYLQMMDRYFDVKAYQVHPRFMIHLGFAAVLAVAARFLASRRGPVGEVEGSDSRGRDARGTMSASAVLFCWTGAVTFAVLPFICGVFRFSKELMLGSDRFGFFYLPVLLTMFFLLLNGATMRWRGTRGAVHAQKTAAGLGVLAMLLGAVIAWQNYNYDFDSYKPANYMTVRADQKYIPAYEWIRANTPQDALFLVDDGFDWTTAKQQRGAYVTAFWARTEFFQIIARRRRVASERLYGNFISNADLFALMSLHRGTFGYPVSDETYRKALETYKPQYIFWRRNEAPFPRGFGRGLKGKVVYKDEVAEFWELEQR